MTEEELEQMREQAVKAQDADTESEVDDVQDEDDTINEDDDTKSSEEDDTVNTNEDTKDSKSEDNKIDINSLTIDDLKDKKFPVKFKGTVREIELDRLMVLASRGFKQQEVSEKLNKYKKYINVIEQFNLEPDEVKALADLKSGNEKAFDYLSQKFSQNKDDDKEYKPFVDDPSGSIDPKEIIDLLPNGLKESLNAKSSIVTDFLANKDSDGNYIAELISYDYNKYGDAINKIFENLEFEKIVYNHKNYGEAYLSLFEKIVPKENKNNNNDKTETQKDESNNKRNLDESVFDNDEEFEKKLEEFRKKY